MTAGSRASGLFWCLFLFIHSNLKDYNLRRFKSIIGFSSKSRVTIAEDITFGSGGGGGGVFFTSCFSVMDTSAQMILALLPI